MRRTVPAYLPAWRLALAVPFAVIAGMWLVGQVVGDRWAWSQVLSWLPALAASVAGAAMVAALWGGRRRLERATRWIGAGVAVLAAGHFAWWSVGWGVAAERLPLAGEAAQRAWVVAHWNPHSPSDTAAECGQALVTAGADVYVISNPGAMLSPDHAGWVPSGWHVARRPSVAVVSRWPVRSLDMLLDPSGPVHNAMWLALATVEDAEGRPWQLLVVDLPSNVRMARGTVAVAVAQHLDGVRDRVQPDLVLGDFNCLESSRIMHVWPRHAPPRPWVCVGWLPTYRLDVPLWRIDWMLAAPPARFLRYDTLDLGLRLHRAQRAVVGLSQD